MTDLDLEAIEAQLQARFPFAAPWELASIIRFAAPWELASIIRSLLDRVRELEGRLDTAATSVVELGASALREIDALRERAETAEKERDAWAYPMRGYASPEEARADLGLVSVKAFVANANMETEAMVEALTALHRTDIDPDLELAEGIAELARQLAAEIARAEAAEVKAATMLDVSPEDAALLVGHISFYRGLLDDDGDNSPQWSAFGRLRRALHAHAAKAGGAP